MFRMARCAMKAAMAGAFMAGMATAAGVVAAAYVTRKAMAERKAREMPVSPE